MSKTIGSLRWDDGYAQEWQVEVKHKNAGLPSVFIHPSNLGGNCKTTLVSSHRKRSLLFLYFPVGNLVCQLFARFISRIPFLYYAVYFLASFCQKFPNRMWIQWTDWATAVCSWSWCSRQRRPYRVRALVTIEIGAKNGVLDPVYPLSCLPSWSKPLSYRKLSTVRALALAASFTFMQLISQWFCLCRVCCFKQHLLRLAS